MSDDEGDWLFIVVVAVVLGLVASLLPAIPAFFGGFEEVKKPNVEAPQTLTDEEMEGIFGIE